MPVLVRPNHIVPHKHPSSEIGLERLVVVPGDRIIPLEQPCVGIGRGSMSIVKRVGMAFIVEFIKDLHALPIAVIVQREVAIVKPYTNNLRRHVG